jgi:folate-dependent phosphoribosylglycinamide formyltransferase PurN
MKIVITAGYNKSLHSIALMHDLKENGHELLACIQIKLIQLNRLFAYIKQYGWETVKAKYKSYVLGEKNIYLSKEIEPITGYLNTKNISDRTIKSFCKKTGIIHLKTNSINDKIVEDFIKWNEVDLIIYAGGGIIRKNIINSSKYGVLNAHSGWLPFFRGMNVIEWSLLYGHLPYTTIHFIDTDIDTGKILYRESIPFVNDLYILRGNAAVHNVRLLVKVINDFLSFSEKALPQQKTDGKQFFVMHRRLKELVTAYLDKECSNINELKRNILDVYRFQ